jgi:hypothetical protein
LARKENSDGTGVRNSTWMGKRSREEIGEGRRWSERGREHELCEERSLNVDRAPDKDERNRIRCCSCRCSSRVVVVVVVVVASLVSSACD